jgi:hypothetical protein
LADATGDRDTATNDGVVGWPELSRWRKCQSDPRVELTGLSTVITLAVGPSHAERRFRAFRYLSEEPAPVIGNPEYRWIVI